MNPEIQKVIDALKQLIDDVPIKLSQFSKDDIDYKPAPEKWSKKEILGHLCDSCFNNLQRIIRVQYEDKPYIVYDQDAWVRNQSYQSRDIKEILSLWVNLHKQFIHALVNFPQNRLDAIVDWGEEVTVHYIITDYLSHHDHHLNQIFKR